MKITLNEFRELVKERVARLLEIDPADIGSGTPDNFEPEIDPDMPPTEPEQLIDYAGLSSKTQEIAHKLQPVITNKLGLEITNILETGRGKHTHENSMQSNKAIEMEYIASVLGILYKKVSDSEKKNIRDYFFSAFSPYSNLNYEAASTLARMVARKAGISTDLRFKGQIEASNYLEIVADAIYFSIDKALKHYDADKSASFGYYFTQVAVNKVC